MRLIALKCDSLFTNDQFQMVLCSEWMSHRKKRETKQHTSMSPGPSVPGCFLVSFHFLCDIHSIHSVQLNLDLPNMFLMLWSLTALEPILENAVSPPIRLISENGWDILRGWHQYKGVDCGGQRCEPRGRELKRQNRSGWGSENMFFWCSEFGFLSCRMRFTYYACM